MKKLERLKINQLQEFNRISDYEQMQLKGGVDMKAAWEYVWQKEVGGSISQFTSWFDSIGSEIRQGVEASIPLGLSTLEQIGIFILERLKGGSTIFRPPIIPPDERIFPGLYQNDPYSGYMCYYG